MRVNNVLGPFPPHYLLSPLLLLLSPPPLSSQQAYPLFSYFLADFLSATPELDQRCLRAQGGGNLLEHWSLPMTAPMRKMSSLLQQC